MSRRLRNCYIWSIQRCQALDDTRFEEIQRSAELWQQAIRTQLRIPGEKSEQFQVGC